MNEQPASNVTDSAPPGAANKKISLPGAIFIGIGSMVGAGIFALFGEAGAIAGAAVWVSFLVGGIIALLQGYSFAKLGARYSSAGGMIDWIVRGYGSGLFTGGVVVLGYISIIVVTAMVAVSFGNYATSLLLGADAPRIWVNIFATAIVILLTFLNSIGADTASKAQTAVVSVVLVVLSSFAIAMLVQIDTSLLAPATYPPLSYILASVALTFFAYLGFGVIAFTGGDLENPKKNLPRAMYISHRQCRYGLGGCGFADLWTVRLHHDFHRCCFRYHGGNQFATVCLCRGDVLHGQGGPPTTCLRSQAPRQ
jgi:amino acid transporter